MSEACPNGVSVLKGAAIGLASGVILVLTEGLIRVFSSALFFTALIQLVYVIPNRLTVPETGTDSNRDGLIIAAAIVLLLSAACDRFRRTF